MGFFDFLKRPAQKEEPIKERLLNLEEVELFLDKKTREIKDKLNNQIGQVKNELNDEITLLKNNLSNLENAEVRNKEIPERAKQVMQGNRQIYLQKTFSLIEKIILPENPSEVLLFIERFDKELDNFDKTISKSHRILEEFFLEKASVIATNIKKIDKLLKEIKNSIDNSDLSKMTNLKNLLTEINDKISQKQEIEQQIKLAEKNSKTESKKIAEKEEKLKNLQQAEDYKKISWLVNEKQSLEKEINEDNSQITHYFSAIEPALKKYENLSENKLAKKYLENPLNVFLADAKLEIADIVKAMRNAIEKGDIELRDKKRDKVLKELNNSGRERFEEMLQKHNELESQISAKTFKIENSVILRDVKSLEENIKEDKIKLDEQKWVLEKMKDSSGEIDVPKLVKELEEEIKDKLSEDVKITVN